MAFGDGCSAAPAPVQPGWSRCCCAAGTGCGVWDWPWRCWARDSVAVQHTIASKPTACGMVFGKKSCDSSFPLGEARYGVSDSAQARWFGEPLPVPTGAQTDLTPLPFCFLTVLPPGKILNAPRCIFKQDVFAGGLSALLKRL